ncbi:flavodoxin [Microbacterium sp. NPDC056736]|uniref:flavodoxin n=1 Tax=Microbacterium sp. NPDC056736 TaxID=3345932 RepID=UPI00366EFB67
MPTSTQNRALLVYFSRAGENYSYGERENLEVGNTKIAAGIIRDLIDIDEYEILAADPYPDDYEATVQRNVREERDDARPAIAAALPDLDAYDTILLGSPVWNVQAPMIMRTFVESVDLTGKTVHPFVTYAVSRMGRVRDDYAEMLPDTIVTEGLAIQGETVREARADIRRWLQAIGRV